MAADDDSRDRLVYDLIEASCRPRVEWFGDIRYVHTPKRVYDAWIIMRAYRRYVVTGNFAGAFAGVRR